MNRKRPTASSAARSVSLPTLAPASPALPAIPAGVRVISRSRSRTYVSYACDACRKIKVKCDGITPQCSACARRGTQCVYNLETDGRRTKDLKREHEMLKSNSRDMLELFQLLKSIPDDEAIDALHRLRTSSSPSSALASIRGGLLATHSPSVSHSARACLPPMSSAYELELLSVHPVAFPALEPLTVTNVDLSLVGVPTHFDVRWSPPEPSLEPASSPETPPIQPMMYLNPQSLSRLYSGPSNHAYADPRLTRLQIAAWTNVPMSNEFAANILSLFFINEHPVQGFFDADLFLDDLVALRTKYCSRLLVNSILAYAGQCYAAVESISSKISFYCYNEAIKHWRDERTWDSLPTVAATMLLSIACNGFGIDSTGLTFLHESGQMAQRLHLFDPPHQDSKEHVLDPAMQRARAATAWGVFNWQTVHSFYFHQPPRMLNPPSLPIPGDWERNDKKVSISPSSGTPPFPQRSSPPYMGHTFPAFCKFFLILHDMVWIFYQDGAVASKATLADATTLYQRFVTWADTLPSYLTRSKYSPHHVINLHIWFHTAIIDCFRPFIRSAEHLKLGEFQSSRTRPEDIFTASIKQLQRLVYVYRSSYDSANTSILWHTAMLYVANDILKDASNPESRFYFLLCLRGYQRLMRCFRIAGSIARSILTIAVRNGIITLADAQTIRQDLERDVDTLFQPSEICSRYIIDLDLALTDPELATMQRLVNDFDAISLSPPHPAEPASATAVPIDFWKGDPKLLLKTLGS
ncbi:hypothetical protein ASPZODRAFT_22227 [Penicilliopsis zonata CBS 506.65]|uniref:Zn(2)-C6 fungal-type domain-containing protein n=1 Tax=Penicilliopsis zonata CBS 506.65 TaxID=1073090 RepID=A0A1L9SX97_9EURO|nr:hypothetical protein ASPZODRAFT_22227 [Penicilliopsis zonata CBS 506.65]OJJ51804.1 hypothetical protein ASPZODRAFT_22227 [Penicilliopsis zonata CBS 506.65]